MHFNKYRKAISVFFAALVLITVCVVLPVTAGAGYLSEAKAEEAAISDLLPGDGGLARDNDSADGNGAGTGSDMLDPDNGTVENDVDHNGSDTSDGMNDSRDTSDADGTSDNASDTSGKKDDATSAKDSKDAAEDLADDVKDEADNMGVWGVIIAIIIIVIIIALIFAFIPKRKK